MDANDEDLMQPNFHKYYQENDLIDVFTHIHPTAKLSATYQRGQHRFDYIFITPALVPALKST
eukprot:2016785-Ditylum_brightwellii.AAC.1